jgi:hypothetical protein
LALLCRTTLCATFVGPRTISSRMYGLGRRYDTVRLYRKRLNTGHRTDCRSYDCTTRLRVWPLVVLRDCGDQLLLERDRMACRRTENFEARPTARVTMALVSRESSAFALCDLKRAQPAGQGVTNSAQALQHSMVLSAACAAALVLHDRAERLQWHRGACRERAMARARPADGSLCSSARGAPCASLLARMDHPASWRSVLRRGRMLSTCEHGRYDVLAPWEHSETSHVSIRVNWVTLLRAKPWYPALRQKDSIYFSNTYRSGSIPNTYSNL